MYSIFLLCVWLKAEADRGVMFCEFVDLAPGSLPSTLRISKFGAWSEVGLTAWRLVECNEELK